MKTKSPSTWRGVVFTLVCAVVCSPATHAQQSTEQFIPIGYSPGISDRYSYVGEILAVDRDARTVSVEDDGVRKAIRVTPETRIWIDRSKRRRASLNGEYTDCKVGRRIEVKYREDDSAVAEWIKIEAR